MTRIAPEFDWYDIETCCVELAKKIRLSHWWPEKIIGMNNGGSYVTAQLSVLLGVPSAPVLDVVKVWHDGRWRRRLGNTATLNPDEIKGKRVLCVDDGIASGDLQSELTALVASMGGEARPAVLFGIGRYRALPDLYVAREVESSPVLPWKKIVPL